MQEVKKSIDKFSWDMQQTSSLEFENKGFPFCKSQGDYTLYHNKGTGFEEIDLNSLLTLGEGLTRGIGSQSLPNSE